MTSTRLAVSFFFTLLSVPLSSIPGAAQTTLVADLITADSYSSSQPFASSSVSLLPDAPSASLYQEPAPAPPPQETLQQRRARERAEAEREVQAQKTQRILGVMPNFNTVLNGQAVPLTPKQKFDIAIHTSVDPFTIGTAFVLAGYSEIDDTHQGYHWGASGYFKRAGANYADTVNGTLIGNALLPVLLKQDPRYFRKGTGSIKSRIVHATLSTFICRGDNGKQQFNLSNVAGNFVSGAISNFYYPKDETGLELTAINATVVTAEGAIGAQLLEFAPDIVRHLHRKIKDQPSSDPQSSNAPQSKDQPQP